MHIKITERANEDLIDIWLYGYEIWGGSNAAPPFRLMPFRSHLIACEVVDDILIILRVLHKNMDTNSKVYQ